MKIFGIRHHGPGSAKRLQAALKAYAPDCLLIELPFDAEKALVHLNNKSLKPPVALLIYPPKEMGAVSYFPMAEFSPEWQALKYAVKKEIPVFPMDLPLGIKIEETTNNKKEKQIRRDPLGHMARLAGYEDSERWWDITFEREDNDLMVFEMIGEMTTALREGRLFDESRSNIAREAFMRKTLRKVYKQGFQKIAVVCGAWHVPAIQEWKNIKEAADNKRLKGLKKIKMEATWIPWNYERLSIASGYGAGVRSPAWYELLFKNKKTLAIRWMSQAARLLRKEGLDASPANTLEGIRLAHTLAAMREKPIIGLEELKDAAITVFCKGDQKLFELIERRLIVGDKVGKVPLGITGIPLQKDFEQQVKSARLRKLLETSEADTKVFDLRKEVPLKASRLLHRLLSLDIKWGRLMKGSRFKQGNFSEKWKLKWSPDYYIKLVEAGAYGNTVEEAAQKKTIEKLKTVESLEELAKIMDSAIKADILETIPSIAKKMQEVAALTKDISSLMLAIPGLVQVFKYGNQRKSEVAFLKVLIEEILIRICMGLPSVSLQVEEETAKDISNQIIETNNAIQLYNQLDFFARWHYALNAITQMDGANMHIKGLCLRILFDKQQISPETTQKVIQDTLNTSTQPLDFAYWLEGFLSGSGLLLIHNEAFWNIINNWVKNLNILEFETLLPILRRTFSKYTSPERNKMLQLATFGQTEQVSAYDVIEFDEKRAEPALKTVRKLLGI